MGRTPLWQVTMLSLGFRVTRSALSVKREKRKKRRQIGCKELLPRTKCHGALVWVGGKVVKEVRLEKARARRDFGDERVRRCLRKVAAAADIEQQRRVRRIIFDGTPQLNVLCGDVVVRQPLHGGDHRAEVKWVKRVAVGDARNLRLVTHDAGKRKVVCERLRLEVQFGWTRSIPLLMERRTDWI